MGMARRTRNAWTGRARSALQDTPDRPRIAANALLRGHVGTWAQEIVMFSGLGRMIVLVLMAAAATVHAADASPGALRPKRAARRDE
jgi:hypothetical protein